MGEEPLGNKVGNSRVGEREREREMSILWEKSGTWRWIVRQTKESKPFFFAFATICGVIPGVIGYGVMQITSSRNQQLESHLRQHAPPDSLVCIFLILTTLLLLFIYRYMYFPYYTPPSAQQRHWTCSIEFHLATVFFLLD